MNKVGSRVLASLAGAGLSTRMVAGLVVTILLTTAAVALPAYALIQGELEHQAWGRVEQGALSSQSLLEAKQGQLTQLTILAAQRPTLRSLLQQGKTTELASYLEAFAEGVSVDELIAWDRTGARLTGPPLPGLDHAPVSGTSIFVAPGPPGLVGILASESVGDPSGGASLGSVSLIQWLDEGPLNELRSETGLEQSILVDGRRVATTLPDAAKNASSPTVGNVVHEPLHIDGIEFYAMTTPLGDSVARVRLETALPVGDIREQESTALGTLAASTAAVALAASAAAVILSRTLTRPLDGLTRAARRISLGDLDTPVPIPSGPGEVGLLAAALEDSRVKIRRHLEDLRREQSWSDVLIQSIAEGIVTVDRAGRIASFSPGAERLTGWPPVEAIGRPVATVFRTPNGTSFMEQLPPPGGRRPVQVLDRAGRTMTLSVTDARVRFPASPEEDLALVLRDVSEDEAVRQLRSYFLANISHEFRTPLSAINASVELLLEDLEGLSKDDIGGLLHSIHLSVTGLQTLIDNLLESLSIEAGRFTIRRHPSDLRRVIVQAARIMRPLLDRREQPLEVSVPPGLPHIRIDPMRVTQVVVNLLSNASKYSPVRQPIELSVERAGQELRVSVCDRGEGIAPEDRENLFRRFVRLDPSDPGQYGVGLGLSVVKAIVDEHGGRVGVEARPGGGSIFWFSLPLAGGPS